MSLEWDATAPLWLRRARPLLGTLVEVGVHAEAGSGHIAVDAAFAAVQKIQACMSRFDSASDVAQFAALPAGASMAVEPETAAVLGAANDLYWRSDGMFDITLGGPAQGWHCEGLRLHKHLPETRFDLGGIAKGYAVDCAIAALVSHDCSAGWINAGGDLRTFGDVEVPVYLRDEKNGGLRPFMRLAQGAVATSYLGPAQRSQIWRTAGTAPPVHVSVAAPQCMWADALTKVVAASGDVQHPLLARYGAQAWQHDAS